ncbi:uncharacterized protein BJ171DRAFT_504226 [Polychytrium aggregatum]|uniref:uncharacterized protein n=1 Tax=Polychytrium aggregatum TaxID=110093 RepID=UPI0022FE64F0|nr:uncharacterized protein BJ171DRAFT_504226 [Polychytrium aggregatum]KAI9204956.1 hypothetical protein BJ171DRAFT_504226 [Polychytrium aggregatum]
MCSYMRRVRSVELRERIAKILCDLKSSPSYHIRMLFLDAVQTALDLCSQKMVRSTVFRDYCDMARDPVSNIRLRVCAMVPDMRRTLRTPQDSVLISELSECAGFLLGDVARDIKELANEVVARFQDQRKVVGGGYLTTDGPSPGQSKEDRDREMEEDRAINIASELQDGPRKSMTDEDRGDLRSKVQKLSVSAAVPNPPRRLSVSASGAGAGSSLLNAGSKLTARQKNLSSSTPINASPARIPIDATDGYLSQILAYTSRSTRPHETNPPKDTKQVPKSQLPLGPVQKIVRRTTAGKSFEKDAAPEKILPASLGKSVLIGGPSALGHPGPSHALRLSNGSLACSGSPEATPSLAPTMPLRTGGTHSDAGPVRPVSATSKSGSETSKPPVSSAPNPSPSTLSSSGAAGRRLGGSLMGNKDFGSGSTLQGGPGKGTAGASSRDVSAISAPASANAGSLRSGTVRGPSWCKQLPPIPKSPN